MSARDITAIRKICRVIWLERLIIKDIAVKPIGLHCYNKGAIYIVSYFLREGRVFLGAASWAFISSVTSSAVRDSGSVPLGIL